MTKACKTVPGTFSLLAPFLFPILSLSFLTTFLSYWPCEDKSKANWSLLVPMLITTCVAIIGWWVVHRFSAVRDRANKRRDLRVQYLIDAYRKLENASNRTESIVNYAKEFESAIADIQLFGSPEQVLLARTFALDFASNGTAPLDPLLDSLRKDLRRELKLPAVENRITYLRITDGKQ